MMATRWLNKDTPFEVPDKPPKVTRDFTPVQLDTMRYWQSFAEKHDRRPTIAEAARHFAITRKALHNRLDCIVKKGGMVLPEEDLARESRPTATERSPTIGVASTRPLYIQTAHGFVGSVIQERKCSCGQSHFTSNDRCADCIRAGSVVT